MFHVEHSARTISSNVPHGTFAQLVTKSEMLHCRRNVKILDTIQCSTWNTPLRFTKPQTGWALTPVKWSIDESLEKLSRSHGGNVPRGTLSICRTLLRFAH